VLDAELKRRIQGLCPEVDRDLIDDFFARMDEDYFTTFSPEEIASHICMSTGLDSKHRVQVRVTRSSSTAEFEIVIVGFDYLSEFSIFCGLLSAFGLDIQAGHIYSFARSTTSRSPRKIVDVFNVTVKPGEVFDATKQREFEQELQRLAHLLATGSIDEARERLNRFLTERIETMNEPLSGLGYPIEIRFDNDVSPDWTLMEARSEDAFALLYGISNALAMQGIYIHNVEIRRVGHEATDHFFIADASGRKIQGGTQQERLRTAVAMIKQFTRFLPEAPDPAKAMRHFDQFLDKMAEEQFPDRIMTFLARSEGMNLLAHLLGSSDYLWDDFLGIHFRNLVPFLERLAEQTGLPLASSREALRRDLRNRLRAAATFDDKKIALNRFKDDQLFLIDAQHLLDPRATVINFSQALTDLAEVVIDEAVNMCSEHIDRPTRGAFTVCGLGKFGGREMGYASDLELLFIHEDVGTGSGSIFESLARRVVECIQARDKGVFQVDLRLRPYGDAGSWSVSFDEFKRYYSLGGQALPFERQALIKLRWVAGNEDLGHRVEARRDTFTYSRAPWDRENALHLRRRQMRELVKAGEINVKYSAGGIIDIEYAVQYLQLLHGKDHPELRLPNTLQALDELYRLQIIQAAEYEVLRPAYLFLRNLIDALRIVRGDASDLLLPGETSEESKALARRLGYRETDRTRAALQLSAYIRQQMKNVHAIFLTRAVPEQKT
jgi:[glutamine synthetase] adenylyltransferase / [glutamine synthetase]-adenylyl-L-tyrosine phosphorylase